VSPCGTTRRAPGAFVPQSDFHKARVKKFRGGKRNTRSNTGASRLVECRRALAVRGSRRAAGALDAASGSVCIPFLSARFLDNRERPAVEHDYGGASDARRLSVAGDRQRSRPFRWHALHGLQQKRHRGYCGQPIPRAVGIERGRSVGGEWAASRARTPRASDHRIACGSTRGSWRHFFGAALGGSKSFARRYAAAVE